MLRLKEKESTQENIEKNILRQCIKTCKIIIT